MNATSNPTPSTDSDALWLSQMADGDPDATNMHAHAATHADIHAEFCSNVPPALLDEWARTHLIGDAVRANALRAERRRTRARVRPSHAEFVQALRAQLNTDAAQADPSGALTLAARHPVTSGASTQTKLRAQLDAAPRPNGNVQHAANEARWKMVAGVASLAAVGAVAFSMVNWQRAAGPQMAKASPIGQTAQRTGTPNAGAFGDRTVAQAVLVGGEPGVMIRDARLMELMAQHKQLGGNALQGPAGFLRNATFNSQACPPSADGVC